MKKYTLLSFAAAIFAFFALSSCDNEPLEGEFGPGPNPPGGGGNANSSFEAVVDSTNFVASFSNAITENDMTIISGSLADGTSIQLTYAGFGTGDFTLSDYVEGDGIASYMEMGQNQQYITSPPDATGSLAVTEYDAEAGVISGNFSFTAQKEVEQEDGSFQTVTVEVTQGVFSNVSLESDQTPPTGGGDATFEVKLDNEMFSANQVAANNNEDGFVMEATVGNQQMIVQVFNPGEGTFNLGNGADADALILYNVDSTNEESPVYTSTEGTLIITSFDTTNKTATGTFNGTLVDSFGEEPEISMTEGVFINVSFGVAESPNSATALIDGEPFEASIFSVFEAGGDTIGISFDSDLDVSIQLTLPQNIETGTFAITAAPAAYSANIFYEEGNSTLDYASLPDTGEITITSVNGDMVSGTFNFTAETGNGDTLTVTEGEFTMDVSM